MSKKTVEQTTALVLCSCSADMTSQKGFVWPGVPYRLDENHKFVEVKNDGNEID